MYFSGISTSKGKSCDLPLFFVLRKFRGNVIAIIPLKIHMPCHCFSLRPANFVSERSEESRAGTENYTAKDFARFFANAQNDMILQGFYCP